MNTVFFDLDGTLTDPVIGITRSIQYALEMLGLQVPAQQELTWCIGPPLLASLRTLAGAAQAERALALYRERFGAVGWRENALYAGITHTLATLAEAGLPLCVATSKPQIYAQKIIEHFELTEYFAQVFGSELDGTRTDKAQLLQFALAARGRPGPAVMVGDRKHDIIGARHHGMRTIGVTYGYGSSEELQQARPDALVQRPEDLLELLLP